MLDGNVQKIIAEMAVRARIEPSALLAVCEVESGGRVFARIGTRLEPVIRFEGHYFDRRLTAHKRETARREGLASPDAGAIANPKTQAGRWRMLERAAKIDRKAAYESTSWGLGQVMGAHWAWLGYSSIGALVEEARSGAAGQVALMLRYIEKAGLSESIRNHDWHAFARGYNGPGYRKFRYHTRIARAYARHRKASQTGGTGESGDATLRPGARGPAVEDLQRMLSALGYPLRPDGQFGRLTAQAVSRFQRDTGLNPTGVVTQETLEKLRGNFNSPLSFSGLAKGFLAILRRIFDPGHPR